MHDKICRIENELSQLSNDITRLLARVEHLRQDLTELTAGLPVTGLTVEKQETTDVMDDNPCECESETSIDVMVGVHKPEMSELQSDDTDIDTHPHPDDIEKTDDDDSDMREEDENVLPPIPPLAVNEKSVDIPCEPISYDSVIIDQQDLSEPTYLEELRKLFTVNDKYRFRRELFGNDNIAMSDTINMIAAMKSMAEVDDYVYSDLEWDKENDDVRAFMDIITFYFLRKGK